MSSISIIQRLKEAHKAAQEAKERAHCVAGDALVAYAGVGRLIDESGLSPDEIAAIDPEIEQNRISYHAAKRWVAAHPNQLEFGSFKLLMDRNESQEQAATSPKSPSVEAARHMGNFFKQLHKIDPKVISDEEKWAFKMWLDKAEDEIRELRGKL